MARHYQTRDSSSGVQLAAAAVGCGSGVGRGGQSMVATKVLFLSADQYERATQPPRSGFASVGDTPSFREIYDDYFGFVWRCAANRGVPSAALDDVAQEVFIVVARKLCEFEGRSSTRTWIAGIVRRVIADYFKKRGNQPAGDEPLDLEPANANAPGEALERGAALELLDSLLASMSDEQREVFVLHELEELSGAEIATITETNENTVWTRLRAARKTFQEGVARSRARRAREEA